MMYVHIIDTPHKNTQNVYFSSKPWVRLGLTIFYYHNKVICKYTFSFPPPPPPPLSPSFSGIGQKEEIFIISQYEMLKLSI
jgi:hypothetical protein